MECIDIQSVLTEQLRQAWTCTTGRLPGSYILETDYGMPSKDRAELALVWSEEGIKITDDGDSFDFLYLSGIDLHSPRQRRRQQQFERTVRRFGAEFDGYAISKTVGVESLREGILDLVDTMRACQSLVDTVQSTPQRFSESVASFFKVRGSRVKSQVRLRGSTLKTVRVDVALNGGGQTLIQTISSTRGGQIMQKVKLVAFEFNDLRRSGLDFVPAVVYDDTELEYAEAWKPRHFQPLRGNRIRIYGIEENRDQMEKLALEHLDS